MKYMREVPGSNTVGPEAILTIRGLRSLLKIQVYLDCLLSKVELIRFFKRR
jgi:hypothetical protein